MFSHGDPALPLATAAVSRKELEIHCEYGTRTERCGRPVSPGPSARRRPQMAEVAATNGRCGVELAALVMWNVGRVVKLAYAALTRQGRWFPTALRAAPPSTRGVTWRPEQ